MGVMLRELLVSIRWPADNIQGGDGGRSPTRNTTRLATVVKVAITRIYGSAVTGIETYAEPDLFRRWCQKWGDELTNSPSKWRTDLDDHRCNQTPILVEPSFGILGSNNKSDWLS